jgi:hypothetical protein
MKQVNTLRGQNVELVNVKVGGTYGYHYALMCIGTKNRTCTGQNFVI